MHWPQCPLVRAGVLLVLTLHQEWQALLPPLSSRPASQQPRRGCVCGCSCVGPRAQHGLHEGALENVALPASGEPPQGPCCKVSQWVKEALVAPKGLCPCWLGLASTCFSCISATPEPWLPGVEEQRALRRPPWLRPRPLLFLAWISSSSGACGHWVAGEPSRSLSCHSPAASALAAGPPCSSSLSPHAHHYRGPPKPNTPPQTAAACSGCGHSPGLY